MCDLYLVLYMFLYVYVAYSSNAVVKSWLAPGCPCGISNRRHMSNMMRLLLVSQ
jgi:hypothetical protein